ncbi:hypothetical protein PSTG_05146 [Puccinia striiformis f. sp. tritici PST-78]|uniref:Uncharacterized protein n=1 Tax=Puccinia striiformis f. sp. tritici PST-78 TaxID=1165861 RepID=A0A0L0VR10_9BASI|nr:hypothetical protein PSTG_05146 [Puccinia striiformis f. sp. tritici PST-78]
MGMRGRRRWGSVAAEIIYNMFMGLVKDCDRRDRLHNYHRPAEQETPTEVAREATGRFQGTLAKLTIMTILNACILAGSLTDPSRQGNPGTSSNVLVDFRGCGGILQGCNGFNRRVSNVPDDRDTLRTKMCLSSLARHACASTREVNVQLK